MATVEEMEAYAQTVKADRNNLRHETLYTAHASMLAKYTLDLISRVRQLEASQRTPNTHEVCIDCGLILPVHRSDCPIRRTGVEG